MSTHLVPDKHIKVPIWGPPPQSVYTQQQEGVRSAIWLTVTLDTELLSQLPLSRRQAFQGCLCPVLEFPLGWFWQMHKRHTKPPFHIIQLGLKWGIQWTLAVLWGLYLIQTGENIPDLSPEWHTKDTQTVAVGQSHTWVMGHFTPKSFPHWLPKYGEPGRVPQSQGVEAFCPSHILWRLLQEKEGAFVTGIRKWLPVLSAGHLEVGWVRDQNVGGRCHRQPRAQHNRPQGSISFWYFPLLREKLIWKRPPSRDPQGRKKYSVSQKPKSNRTKPGGGADEEKPFLCVGLSTMFTWSVQKPSFPAGRNFARCQPTLFTDI